jgi:hypothetical protein
VDRVVLAPLQAALQPPARSEVEAVLPFQMDLSRLKSLSHLEALRRNPGDVDDQHPPLAQTLYATDPAGIVKIEGTRRRGRFSPCR